MKNNFKMNEAVAWAIENNYPVIMADNEKKQFHFIRPDQAWRPEYAMLPTGLEKKDWHPYNLVYNKEQIDQEEVDHNVIFPDDKIGEYYSDRDGFARLVGQRSFAEAHSQWQPITSAKHLRQLKIKSLEEAKRGLIVNTKGEYAFIEHSSSFSYTPLNTGFDSEIAFILV